ncbi:APC family permease [Chitinophaga barathri]|uniref:Amino acid permease n=1 Tax=Chitinophaga barathri TaxID=1647451 RepID=A0A3N4MD85_9BACT|nr:amino acid permease [Chitinophaga barathri]RPD41834.1 amino acid permease [Chitinophaga barathri]
MPAERHQINYLAATAIVVGSIIGSGIFMKPATMAAQLQSPIWLTLVWMVGGVFSLAGALVFAEIGAMFPSTGGLYVYYRRMFGDFFGFLYGWAGFTVLNTASVAAIAFVCAQYLNYFLRLPGLPPETAGSVALHIPFLGTLYPLQNAGVKLLAVSLVLGLTLLNYLSLKAGSLLQVLSTVLKIVVVALLVFGIFFSGKGDLQNFVTGTPAPGTLFSGFIAALTGAFMAYDGWINVTFVAGEMKDPQRNIPRSLFTGVVICMFVYLLVNQAYLYVLPVDVMAGSPLVAADAIAVALGATGSSIVAALIVICTIGAINGNTMAVCRVTYAMGKDGLFFHWAGREHPRYLTPGNALWLHGIWGSLLVISGSFDMLADMFTFIAWVAYLFGALGLFLLRFRMPEHPRPYKAWGYPVLPALFVCFAGFYVVSTVWNDVTGYVSGRTPVINSLLGLAITALGAPVYGYFIWKKKRYLRL